MVQSKSLSSLESLTTAEEFLDYFNISFDPQLVTPKRIALLRLFRQELEQAPEPRGYKVYKRALLRAYRSLLFGNTPPLEGGVCGSCTECDD
ncbi:nitrogenase-stabilizing/protective protein NifW [Vibrio sp. M260118]|uniref:nitrogenase-stabilizing/protective protein NifW n=1 Tax=Vibrio sp. M260118 TaxID=3020896 RepID=UPI002F4000DB